MKKVCQDWAKEALEPNASLVDPKLWDLFEKNAKAAAAEVFVVDGYAGALQKALDIIHKFDNCHKVVAAGAEQNPELAKIFEGIKADGEEVYTDKFDIAEESRTADMGISSAEFCVAETGSVCVDTYSYEARVVSMLPPGHIVFVNKKYVTETLTTAFQIIAKVYKRGHMGFITGPSRTADIERVLTLGCHGPGRFFVIAIDNIEGSVD